MEAYIPTHLGFLLYSQVITHSDLCDVVIVCGNGEVRCHSCVISMASEKIRQWLRIATLRENKKIIIVEHAEMNAVIILLKYIYTGTEAFNEASVGEIIRVATIFECKNIIESCFAFLRRRESLNSTGSLSDYDKSPVRLSPIDASEKGEKCHTKLHSVIRLAPSIGEGCQSPTSSDAEIEVDDSSMGSPTRSLPPTSTPLSLNPGHFLPRYGPNAAQIHHAQSTALAAQRNVRQYSMSELRKYCSDCKKTFATVGSYTRHLRMIHYKLKPLSCHVCHHAFYQRSDLKKHIQRQHPDEQQSPLALK